MDYRHPSSAQQKEKITTVSGKYFHQVVEIYVKTGGEICKRPLTRQSATFCTEQQQPQKHKIVIFQSTMMCY